jgi:hypothetical protein
MSNFSDNFKIFLILIPCRRDYPEHPGTGPPADRRPSRRHGTASKVSEKVSTSAGALPSLPQDGVIYSFQRQNSLFFGLVVKMSFKDWSFPGT